MLSTNLRNLSCYANHIGWTQIGMAKIIMCMLVWSQEGRGTVARGMFYRSMFMVIPCKLSLS
jgi:hypothetical protein